MIYINHQLNELDCLLQDIFFAIDNKAEKSLRGIIPRFLWEEKRAKDLLEAMLRYYVAGKSFNPAWQIEYDELVMSWSDIRKEEFFKYVFQ